MCPHGRAAKVLGYPLTLANFKQRRFPNEFRWYGLAYNWRPRSFPPKHQELLDVDSFRELMDIGDEHDYVARVTAFFEQHFVSFELRTLAGYKSNSRVEGLLNAYLLALAFKHEKISG